MSKRTLSSPQAADQNPLTEHLSSQFTIIPSTVSRKNVYIYPKGKEMMQNTTKKMESYLMLLDKDHYCYFEKKNALSEITCLNSITRDMEQIQIK